INYLILSVLHLLDHEARGMMEIMRICGDIFDYNRKLPSHPISLPMTADPRPNRIYYGAVLQVLISREQYRLFVCLSTVYVAKYQDYLFLKLYPEAKHGNIYCFYTLHSKW